MTRPEVFVREEESPLRGGNEWRFRVVIHEWGHAYDGWWTTRYAPGTHTSSRGAWQEAERIAVAIGGIVAYPWDYHPCS